MRALTAAALVVLVSLAAPSAAGAAAIELSLRESGASFGLEPFTLEYGRIDVDYSFPYPGQFVYAVSLVSGPLLDLDVILDDPDRPLTVYSYGAGTFTLAASGMADDGTFVQGGFTTSTDPFSFTVCEGCDHLFGGGLSEVYFNIGRAVSLDEALARALHVKRAVSVTWDGMPLEDIGGDATSVTRVGFGGYASGSTELTINVAVPEPGLLLLGALSAGAFALRRRRSGRA